MLVGRAPNSPGYVAFAVDEGREEVFKREGRRIGQVDAFP